METYRNLFSKGWDMARSEVRKRANKKIGIRDRLGRLTYRGACRMLGDGEDGEKRLRAGGKFEINLPLHVKLRGDMLRV